jgi:protein-L-isoaspartate(D-aspartate) O-methyltransferase
MVRFQLEGRDITDRRVLNAMAKVPRHLFVPPELCAHAYEDRPQAIGHGQTISQPYVVALMTQLATEAHASRALDVGTGCGYQAAILAEIVEEVQSLEIIPQLAEEARERLEQLGYHNIHLHCADGHEGWPQAAPFDVIIVACSAHDIPEPLVEQLAPGGKLVIPVGSVFQELRLVEKLRDGETRRSSAGGVAFVPMVRAKRPRD